MNSSCSLNEDCRTSRVQRTAQRGLSNSLSSLSADSRTRRVRATVERQFANSPSSFSEDCRTRRVRRSVVGSGWLWLAASLQPAFFLPSVFSDGDFGYFTFWMSPRIRTNSRKRRLPNSLHSLSEDCRTRQVQATFERGLRNSPSSSSEDCRTR